MRILPLSLCLASFASTVLSSSPQRRSYGTHSYYVLEHDPHAGTTLEDCTRTLGVEVIEQVGELRNHWLVRVPKKQSPISARTVEDVVMKRYEQLRTITSESSRHGLSVRSDGPGALEARRTLSSIKYLSPQEPRRRVKRDGELLRRAPPSGGNASTTSEAIASRLGFVDPLFTKQWHIVNDEFPQHMMNVTGVWEMGITGEGVITALVDDGLDYKSNDLAANFDALGSYDFNDHVDLPTPVLSDDHHGTRCAGQIAAAKNDVCGVGLAYDAKVAGLRILSGPITDVDEAASLNYAYQNTSIYSCSWGPPDDGKSMEGPGYLIQKAVINGIQNGRGGKGSVYVFASGNGAAFGDQCNFDGYTNSIYSVTVSAVDYKGLHPFYSEPCAANMVVAYSSGGGHFIVTTDVGENKCAMTHGGTSAAAPNAAGVFTLALQARPDLSWRDIQHLCVQTGVKINPDDPDWEDTSSGRPFSYKYGFGRLDAYAFVTAAQNWKLVKPQAWFEPPAIQLANGTMDEDGNMSGGQLITSGGLRDTFTVTQEMMDKHNFEKLEHVTVRVWITHSKRGDVEVELTSPNGIRSVLAANRKSDYSQIGFPGWRFMSVKHWAENPVGNWTIRVSDQGAENQNGSFLGWRMMFWGSTVDAAKAKTYVLSQTDDLLPSPEDEEEPVDIPTPTTSKSHPKPTSNLPDDHGTQEGEADTPAFPGKPEDDSAEATASPTMTPTPDEGWFADMSNLVSNKKWFFGALGAVLLFGIAAGVFFWRRRVVRMRSRYSAVRDVDDVAMGSISQRGASSVGRPRTKELYDAFGEVSDDDEDADEETGLRPNRSPDHTGGLGFHSGFLDDEEPSTAGPTPLYRDDPEVDRVAPSAERRSLDGGSASNSSGDGSSSWEHASQTQ